MKSPGVLNPPVLLVPPPVPWEQLYVTLVPGVVVQCKATWPKGHGRGGKLRQRHGLKQIVEDRRLPTERVARV